MPSQEVSRLADHFLTPSHGLGASKPSLGTSSFLPGEGEGLENSTFNLVDIFPGLQRPSSLGFSSGIEPLDVKVALMDL